MSDIERATDMLSDYANALRNGDLDGAGHSTPADIEEVIGRIEAQQAGSGEAVGHAEVRPIPNSIDYFDNVISPAILAWALHSDELLARRIWDSVRRAVLTPTPQPTQSVPEGMDEFLADLTRSRTKYPNNARMFDGLLGEVDELRRAYHGDGDVRAEAFDVAVCAFRIAVEGDSGGNEILTTTPQPADSVPETDDKVRWILGRPNFSCARIAQCLRAQGHEIKNKAEDEQAEVIHWMLGLYAKHGGGWRKEAEAILANQEQGQ